MRENAVIINKYLYTKILFMMRYYRLISRNNNVYIFQLKFLRWSTGALALKTCVVVPGEIRHIRWLSDECIDLFLEGLG